MPNIELKSRYADLAKARELALALGGKLLWKDEQIDTYFETKTGKLKLRQSGLNGSELLPYQKIEQEGLKRSDYVKLPVLEPNLTRTLLSNLLGRKAEVRKTREVYLINNVRVHLDEVLNLGAFLEFEAVFETDTPEAVIEEQKKVLRLMEAFGIQASDRVEVSYPELLSRQSPRPILQGRCVRLEPLGQNHVPDLTRHFDVTLFQYYPKTNYSSAQEFCDENWECEKSGTFEPFAIIDQSSNQAIGCVEYSSIDRRNRKLEIGGSWLGRKFQGGPWNTEAKLLLLTEAFERRNCLRVQFGTDSLNVQSQAALEKIGAKREGTVRNDRIQPDGRIRHNVYFSIIAEDWPKTKEHLIIRLREKLEKFNE